MAKPGPESDFLDLLRGGKKCSFDLGQATPLKILLRGRPEGAEKDSIHLRGA